jgi:hypothetical protein
MNFFDVMSLVTIGRGGVFEEVGSGELRYRASGREPVLWAGSRRGLPYRAKPVYGAMPPVYPVRFFDEAAVGRLRARAGAVDFRRDVWPLIARDAWLAYFGVVARTDPGAVLVGVEEFAAQLAAPEWDPAGTIRSWSRWIGCRVTCCRSCGRI